VVLTNSKLNVQVLASSCAPAQDTGRSDFMGLRGDVSGHMQDEEEKGDDAATDDEAPLLPGKGDRPVKEPKQPKPPKAQKAPKVPKVAKNIKPEKPDQRLISAENAITEAVLCGCLPCCICHLHCHTWIATFCPEFFGWRRATTSYPHHVRFLERRIIASSPSRSLRT
jgi:hypothetical protein